jgi:Bacterial membrane protein YfhO
MALLALLSCGVFWRSLSGRLVVVGYDLSLYAYPYRVAVAEALRQGRLPFWNPHVYLGVPLLANIPSAVFYPGNLLFVLTTRPQILTVDMILHVFLSGAFLYALGRRALRATPAAALLGATAFCLSGFSIQHSEQLNIGNSLPWVPVVILGLDQAYRLRSPRWAALMGAGLCVQIFAGHPQIVYYTGLVAAAWLVGLLLGDLRTDLAGCLRGLAVVGLGAAAGLLLAGVQFLPTLELSRQSLRSGGVGIEQAGAGPLRSWALFQQFFGDYAHGTNSEWAACLGIVALGLAVLGVFARRREPLTWTLAGVSLLAVLLSFGYPTPQFNLAYHFLPGVSLFRAPSRILLITTFTLPVLAIWGAMSLRGRQAAIAVATMFLITGSAALAYLLQQVGEGWLTTKWYPAPPVRAQLLAWGVICVAAALVAIGARRLKWAPIPVLIVLSCADLLLAAQPSSVAHPVDPVIYARQESTTSLLPTSESPYRSLSVARTTDASTPVVLPEPAQLDLLQRDVIEHPNLTTRDGLASVDGYEGGILPLGPYIDFRRLLLPPGFQNQPDLPFTYVTSEPYNRPLLELLGVRYLLVSAPQGLQEARRLGYRQVAAADGLAVFEDDQALPRSHLVGDVVAVGDDSQALGLLASPSFDPRRTATLSRISCPTSGTSQTEAQLVRNDAETVEARTHSQQTSLLVVSNVDYPGWTAQVDGRPAPVGRVDGLLQGVCLSPGDHHVVLRFRPTQWSLAVTATGSGALALLALIAFPALRRRWTARQTERASQRSRG